VWQEVVAQRIRSSLQGNRAPASYTTTIPPTIPLEGLSDRLHYPLIYSFHGRSDTRVVDAMSITAELTVDALFINGI
ncbi:MAG: hypothetical protein ACREK1_08890, partial [Longimicrobiales bacterium]